MKIKGMSLFSGGGIGEFLLDKTNVEIVIANEILKTRCDFYKFYHPKTDIVNLDITKPETKSILIEKAIAAGVDFIMATPPCQGASLIGKNKDLESMKNDFRNYLVFDAVEIIEAVKPSFVLIENVTRFYDMLYLYNNHENVSLMSILNDKFGNSYYIDYSVFSTEDYGVPQCRKRGIIRMWKKEYQWDLPKKEKHITVRDAIGDLPSLEAGETSNIKNHYARKHTREHVLCMKHTPTGHSAFENDVFFPKNKDGKKIRGFSATFKRIDWDAPAPTITMRNDCISSQSNVHPGRLLSDGTYSDARVLTMRELFLLSSMNPDMDLPTNISDSQIRYMVGEGIPPRMVMKIVNGIHYHQIIGASLFSSAGIAETYLKDVGIDIRVANELLGKRCRLHRYLYPNCEMINGDITDNTTLELIDKKIKDNNAKFLLATPPCQGMSSLGKKEYSTDKRNYLIFYVMDLIDKNDFDYILVENVPKFLKLFFPFEGKLLSLVEIFKIKYSDNYNIDSFVLNAKDYGVPQSRPRGFIRIWKKGLIWEKPAKQKEITLRECIGNLPSLMPGEDSGIKWHYAKNHNQREVLAMLHTPEGCSALKNEFFYPKKDNGEAIKGFHNTYKRMKWDEPCPARAMNNGNLGGHNNCHPGRVLNDGTISDPRVLTLRELFIVSSLDPDWDLPEWATDNFVRQVIGEAIPPNFAKAICSGMRFKND